MLLMMVVGVDFRNVALMLRMFTVIRNSIAVGAIALASRLDMMSLSTLIAAATALTSSVGWCLCRLATWLVGRRNIVRAVVVTRNVMFDRSVFRCSFLTMNSGMSVDCRLKAVSFAARPMFRVV